MERPYVEELRIQSYGCIRDATFRLTPLHALIGPNDSGKSTVLRALRTVVYLAGKEPDQLTQLALSVDFAPTRRTASAEEAWT